MQYYTSLLIASILAFLFSTTLCYFLIKVFKSRRQKGKRGSGFRQMHDEVIPRFGGIGIVSGFWGTLVILFLVKPELVTHHYLIGDRFKLLYWLAPLSIATFLLGLVDDTIFLRARYKLVTQILIATITALTILPIHQIEIPFWGSFNLGAVGIVFAVLWIVGVINAVNLIDGLDTLAGGVAIIALAGISFLSWRSYDMVFLSISLILISAISGFLVHNSHPARVFMGDGGSHFLGYMLAVLPMLQVRLSTDNWSLAPIILLGLPITDTLFSIIRRTMRGLPPFSPDKNHIHHRIIEKGLTHQQSVRRLHGVSLIFLAVFISVIERLIDNRVGFVSFFACAWLLILYAGYEEVSKPRMVYKNRDTIKRDRSFSIEFSENIDVFFRAASEVEEIIFVLAIWAELMQAQQISVQIGGENFCRTFCLDDKLKVSCKKLVLEKENVKMDIFFEIGYLNLDSDLKFKAINLVFEAVFRYTRKLLIEKHSAN